MKKNQAILLGITSAAVLAALTAGATAYYMDSKPLAQESAVKTKTVNHVASTRISQPQTPVQAQQVAAVQPQCNDRNIVGTVVGGVGGGLVGSQFGNGSGKTAATIGGVVGGAVLGNEFIPTRNVTCRN